MPPKSQLDYVQRLIRAEEERNRIIGEARAKKQQKVRQAKVDAERAVSDFKKEKDAELGRYQETLNAGASNDKLKVTSDTEKVLDVMRKTAMTRIDRVADILSDMICAVDIGSK